MFLFSRPGVAEAIGNLIDPFWSHHRDQTSFLLIAMSWSVSI